MNSTPPKILNGYVLENEFYHFGGNAQWTFAEKNEKQWFVKRFTDPVRPDKHGELDPEYIEHIGADSRTGHKEVQLSSALFDSNPGTFAQRIHETNTAQLKKGELVTHSKFGEGVVISCKNGIAEIAFPYPYGVKKIAAGHPSIKRKSQMRS